MSKNFSSVQPLRKGTTHNFPIINASQEIRFSLSDDGLSVTVEVFDRDSQEIQSNSLTIPISPVQQE